MRSITARKTPAALASILRPATILAAVLALAAAGCGEADEGPVSSFTAAWTTSMMAPEPQVADFESRSFNDETLRQVVVVAASGERVRLRLSNLFGTQPLAIAEVRVATELGPGGVAVTGKPHPGIAEIYPEYPEKEQAGFLFLVPQVPAGPHTLVLTLIGRDGGETVLKRAIRVH